MDQRISAAEANRGFSRLLREVREGQSFVITAHGRPVARIVPCGAETDRDKRQEAWRAFVAELRARPAMDPPAEPWTRDELYGRD